MIICTIQNVFSSVYKYIYNCNIYFCIRGNIVKNIFYNGKYSSSYKRNLIRGFNSFTTIYCQSIFTTGMYIKNSTNLNL